MFKKKHLLFAFALLATVALGACNEPQQKKCLTKKDCDDGQICDTQEKVCKAKPVDNDPCKDIDCGGHGVCDPNATPSPACVNPETCAEDSECLENYKCMKKGSKKNTCMTEQQICDSLDCSTTGGLCDAKKMECVNPPDGQCNSIDKRCIKEYYCAETTHKCEANLCEASTSSCPRGECDPSNFPQCRSKSTCETNKDCIENSVCVGTICKPHAEVCAENCKGNQVCEDGALTAKSVVCKDNEAEGCHSAIDCVDPSHVCAENATAGKNTCQAPSTTCDKGDHEPGNDTSAVELLGTHYKSKLCGKDTDLYKITQDHLESGDRLVVKLKLDPIDVGAGTVKVEVSDGPDPLGEFTVSPDGANPAEGMVDVPAPQPTAAQKTKDYRIKVSSEDAKDLDYTLFTHFLTNVTINACQIENTIKIPAGQSEFTTQGAVGGDPAASKKLASKCGAKTNMAPEEVYSFTVEQRSLVTINLEKPAATKSAKVIMGLRTECLDDDSEFACSYPFSTNIHRELEPGTYFLVVQGEDDTQATHYDLTYKAEPIVCTPGKKSCVGDPKHQITQCNIYGTGTIPPMSCGVDSSDNQIPTCVQDSNDAKCVEGKIYTPLVGNDCKFPHVVSKKTGNVYENTDLTLKYANNTDRISIDCPTISGGEESVTVKGSEIVARVEALHGEQIRVTYGNDKIDSAVFIVKGNAAGTDCVKVEGGVDLNKCVSGIDKKPHGELETLTYKVQEDGVYYVIAGEGPTVPLPGTANHVPQLTVDVLSLVCQAGTQRCNGNVIEVCNASEDAFDTVRTCAVACKQGTPLPHCAGEENDKCLANLPKEIVFDASGMGSAVGYFEDYRPSQSVAADSCGAEYLGSDASYIIKGVEEGDVYTIKYNSEEVSALFLEKGTGTTCNNDLLCNNVLIYSEKGKETTLKYKVEPSSPDSIKLIVKAKDLNVYGKFMLDVQKAEKQCDAGKTRCNSDNTKIEQCNGDGTDWVATTCTCVAETSTEPAHCDGSTTPDGNSCANPLVLTASETVTSYTDNFPVQNDGFFPGVSERGMCDFTSTNAYGGNKYFKVTIPANKVLEFRYSANASANAKATAYFLAGTCDLDQCKKNSSFTTYGTLYYYNDTGAEVKGIVVLSEDAANDSALDSDHSFRVSYRVYEATCKTPETAMGCSKDRSQLEYCDRSYEKRMITCENGCGGNGQNAACNPQPNDSCATKDGIVEIVAGTPISTNLYQYTNKVDHGGEPTCEKTNIYPVGYTAAPGPDALYKYTANGDKTVTLTLTSDTQDLALYAMADCKAIPSTCLDGDDSPPPVSSNTDTETLVFSVDDGQTVYIVVDSKKPQLMGNTDYTLSLSEADRECTPNTSRCSTTGTPGELEVCDSVGRVNYTQLCPKGCTENGGAVDCKGNADDTCPTSATKGEIEVLKTDGTAQAFNFEGYNDKFDLTVSDGHSCGLNGEGTLKSSAVEGRDRVFLIKGDAGKVAVVTLTNKKRTSVFQDDLTGFLLDGCDPAKMDSGMLKCVSRSAPMQYAGADTSVMFSGEIPTSGELYLVVDSKDESLASGFEVSVQLFDRACDKGVETKCEEVNGVTSKWLCNSTGTDWLKVADCGNLGCDAAGKACNTTLSNNDCGSAHEVVLSDATPDFRFAPTTQGDDKNAPLGMDGMSSTYNPGQNKVEVCSTWPTTGGPDSVYKVKAPAGKVVSAAITYISGGQDYVIYSTKDASCSQIDSGDIAYCDATTLTGARKITWYNENDTDYMYVIVDSKGEKDSGAKSQKYTLTFSMQDSACNPSNPPKCHPTDNTKLLSCSGDGLVERTTTCALGCESGKCKTAKNDVCGGATEIRSTTGTVQGNIVSKNTNAFDFDTCYATNYSFKNTSKVGRDLIYKVIGTAGEVIHAKLSSNVDMGLFAMTYDGADCDVNVSTICHSASFKQNSGDEEVKVAIPSSGHIYLIVDSEADGAFELNVDYLPAVCDDANYIGKSKCDGGVMKTCNLTGTEQTSIVCTGTCDDSVMPVTCTQKTDNKTCTDAVEIEDGKTYELNVDDYPAADKYTAQQGTCYAAFDQAKAVYSIELGQNEVVKITPHANSTFDTSVIWANNSCSAPSSPECKKASSFSSSARGGFTFANTQSGPITAYIYFDIDRSVPSLAPTGTFTFDVEVLQQTCTPGAKTCNSAGFLEVCNDDGLGISYQRCSAGCDSTANECRAITNDTCSETTAVELLAGGKTTDVVHGTFDDYTAEHNSAQTCKASPISDGEYPRLGKDAVYKVNLAQDEKLTFFLEANATTRVVPEFYIVKDCSEITTTCFDVGWATAGGVWKTITADAPGDYYIVIDTFSNTPSGTTFDLYAFRGDGTCSDPSAVTCTSGQLSFCAPNGKGLISSTCDGGCNASNDGCNQPRGDSCADAVPLANGSVVYGGYSNGVDSMRLDGINGLCSFGYPTYGRNTYYKVTVPNGQTLTASLNTSDTYPMLMLFDSTCTPSGCLNNGRQSLRYENTSGSDQELFLSVDSENTRNFSVSYTLQVSIQ